MGTFKSDERWLPVLQEQEEKLRFKNFSREDALAIGLRIIELAKSKYKGNVAVRITEDKATVFACMMPEMTLEKDLWINRKLNVSKATGISSLRAYMEITSGRMIETWRGREDSFAACGGCMPVFMIKGPIFAYITVSGLEHHLDHQIIADAVAERLGVQTGSVA